MSHVWYFSVGKGQEGPVDFEELRELARIGTLDREKSLVWREGFENWVPAGKVEGLFPSVGEGSSVEPPPALPVDADASQGVAGEGNRWLSVGYCIKQGWGFAKRHLGLFIGTYIVYVAVVMGVDLILRLGQGKLGVTFDEHGAVTSGFGVFVVAALLSNVFSIFMSLGLTSFALKIVDEREASVGDLFSQSPRLISAILATIIYLLVVGLGLLCFVLPGIYLALRMMYYQAAIVDHRLGPINALEHSWNITRGNTWRLFLLMLASFLINLAGMMALLVGLIWALPTTMMAYFVAYRFLERVKKIE